MKLEAASTTPPKTLREFLTDLGDGENGFMGTRVPAGEVSLEDYLQQCCAMTDETMLRPGLVPQTTFWALSDVDGVVGMVRMRHYLNDNLRIHGGHIGYYIRRDQRDKGYGKKILALALAELQKLGEKRALITTSGDNARILFSFSKLLIQRITIKMRESFKSCSTEQPPVQQ